VWLRRLFDSSARHRRGPQRIGRSLHPVRLCLEALEDRTLLSVTIAGTNNGGNGYTGIDYAQSQGIPPDSQGAVGPTNYVETTNQEIAIYSPKSTGASKVSDSLGYFLGTVGGLPIVGDFDPVSIYDDNMPGQTASTGRFIIEDMFTDTAGHKSTLDVAVSKSASPQTLTAADWNFYQINSTLPDGAYDADFPGNLGFNKDAVFTTLNMRSENEVAVVSLNATDLVNGVTQSQLHVGLNKLTGIQYVRPTTEHDAVAGDPEWLVSEVANPLDRAHINVYKMTNVLSSNATFTTTTLAVNAYQGIAFPLNPDFSRITDTTNTSIQKVAEANNTLVATQTVGVSVTQDDVRWYIIDVSSGTPTIKDQGDVTTGDNTYLVYPSIDINPSGQIGMTYMRTGTDSKTDYLSMWITGRTSSDPAGTMETPVLVPAGAGQTLFNGNGRAGDISGINIDPSDGSFWAVNEFANTEAHSNWGTAIVNFTLGTAAATQVSLSSLFNRTGIYKDGSIFSNSSGLDGLGHAYSNNLLGTSVSYGGNPYAIGPDGANDAVRVASQVVTLPTGSYSTLSFLATAVNGNQTNLTFTVTYTDNSTQQFTRSFSDWHTPQSYTGESQAVTMNYGDLYTGGKDSRNYYLYAYSFQLTSGKQVKSVTLPNTPNVELLAMDLTPTGVAQVNLSSAFNRTGIYNDGSTFSSNSGLDGLGHAYSANLLGSSVTYGGNSYAIGPAGSSDAVRVASQVITLPSGNYSYLSFLATAVNGNQTNLTFTVTYTDNTTQTFTQSFSDWHTPQNYSGESQAVAMSYGNLYSGGKDSRNYYLYAYSFPLNSGKQVKSVTLPNTPNVELFAMDLIP
jgi:hypothetical protein